MTNDDPKLTAYALNELDQADRAEVEAYLAENLAARAVVEEIRRTVALLTAGFQAVTAPALTTLQRETITSSASTPAVVARSLSYEPVRRPARRAWAKWALATAACAALAAGGFSVWNYRQMTLNRQVATIANLQTRNTKSVIASLIERSQEQIDKRNYKQALGIMAQIKELDPKSDYVRGVYPLVNDAYNRAPKPYETRDREFTNSLNAGEHTVHYEDVLRYPENWPELSIDRHVTKTTQAPDGGALSLSGQAIAAGTKASASGSLRAGAEIHSGDLLFDWQAVNAAPTTTGGYTPAPFVTAGVDAGRSSQINALQNSAGFTSSPTTGIPGSIGVTGAGSMIAGKELRKGAISTFGSFGMFPGSGDSSGVGAGPSSESYVDGYNSTSKTAPINGVASGQPHSYADGRSASGQLLSRGDLDALVAHYRLRGADGIHLLDGGVVGYTQAQFEEDAKTGNFPPQVIAAMQRQLEHTATAPNESYAAIHDNPFLPVAEQPLSTFSIDVDTGSYSNIRRFLNDGQFPPPDAVRIEEMLNYFPYHYETPKPDSKEPFATTIEIAGCPWNSAHRLARVAIKGREIAHDKRPVSNLVFLIDVSGSMNEPAKLPLVKEGLKLMVNELTENDRISIVVYAGNAGLVLPSTTADPKSRQTILNAIDNLSAGGSTNGGEGIQLAYKIATDNFIKGGTNRVLLATDGDWNVGITDQSSLTQLIEDKAKSGVFLSVLGYGFGNLKDATMEKLADKGNGHYAYIDNLKESKKVLVEEMSSTLVTIAKDVKIQVEFNPSKVESYRLIGYEKRLLRKEDFNNDKVDAGEIGAGHCVTALYEITPLSRDPKGSAPATEPQAQDVDSLKYQKHEVVKSDDLMTLKLRYKQPDGDTSAKLEFPAIDKGLAYSKASEDFKFSAAVAQFGMILRSSPYRGTASLDGVLELADEGKGKDEKGYRSEFLEMVKKAKALMK